MKLIKRLLASLFTLIALSVVLLYVTGNGFIITSIQRTYLVGNVTANINDHTEFNVRVIKTGEKSELSKHAKYNTRELPTKFLKELEKYGTSAFLVLKDGQLIYEKYLNGYDDRSKTNSFSVAKTVTTLLLGIAIKEGHVQSLKQPITDFLPEFKDDPLGRKATVEQLSLMNSGYEWTEHYYSPFSPTVELYHGDNIEEFLLEGHFSAEPGTFWEYSSASTELLGILLTRALQKAGAADNLSDYLSRKIWQPLEMNDDALWHLDNSGMELVFCCINTNAHNYSKLGLLMLNGGNWDGKQIVPANFIQQMTRPVGQPFYGLSTWLSPQSSPAYYWFSGHLGQYIINVPEHNMIVVRVGEGRNPRKDFRADTLPEYVKMGLSLID